MYTSNIFFLIFLVLPTIIASEEHQAQQFSRPPTQATGGSAPGRGDSVSGFTVGANNVLDAQLTQNSLSGKVTAGVGGQIGSSAPQQYYQNQYESGPTSGYNYYDAQALSHGPSTSLWSYVNYYVAGGVFFVVLFVYYFWNYFFNPRALKAAADAVEEEEEPVSDTKDTKVASKKTRRRREIRRNEEAARLASIVLSAIESGECLQKSICLMGSQIGGTEKGKLAMAVLEKLIPKSVQTSNYYTVLQKSLRGEAVCEKYKCNF